MAPTCGRQRFEILNLRGDDFVTVVGDEDNGSIDQIRHSRRPEENAGCPTQVLVDRPDIHTRQSL